MPNIELKGQAIAYKVRASKRAKRISIRYSLQQGLEVVYPPGAQQPTPETLLLERSDWILSAYNKFKVARANLPRREYRAGEVFLFRGASYKLLLEQSTTASKISVRLTEDCLVVSSPDPPPGTAAGSIRSAIEGFYRRKAQGYIPKRVRELADEHSFDYAHVRIKNQKTRWGSCSAKRNINLNLRLMMAPDPAIDYVIIHELCHLREMNHTRAYWSLVESHCPDYRHWKDWFRQHGPSLML
jgi:hypothetical protein